MQKRHILINIALLLSLVGCSNPKKEIPDNALLKPCDMNAKFVASGYGENAENAYQWMPLATYLYKNNGEAPYVEVGQFLDLLNNLLHIEIDYNTMTTTRNKKYDSSIAKISDHKYGIYSECVLGAVLDTKENVFNIKRFDYMFVQPDSFNGILRNDVASPKNSKESLVHGSSQSKYIGSFKEENYDLDDYNMDILEIEDKVYMPAQLLSNMFLRGIGVDFLYNGNDFFLGSAVSTNSSLEGSFHSTNNTFAINNVLYSQADPVGEEECRYVGKVVKEEATSYTIYSLNKDGSGFIINDATPTSTDTSNPTHKLTWARSNNDMYITSFVKDIRTGAFAENGNTMRISSNETFFNKKTRSKALSDFNYQLLRFQIENLYGLKDELHAKQGFNDFDSFVTEKGLKDKLLSTDTRTYDEGLCEFLMKYIDDGHTKYTERSVFSGLEDVSSNDLVDRYMGPRRKGLLDKLTEYTAYRKSVLGEDVDPIGLSMEGETAVIRFDSFLHIMSLISDPGSATDALDLPTLMKASSPMGFFKAFKEIAKNSGIKNVVIDLTCNGGGMVLTLPFLAAYFTKDPTIYVRDVLSGVIREFHYNVDINCDGVRSGEGDYLGDKYHFYLLTSDFSFSCASALPTMAHIAGVDIIGTKCGGGACNVGGFSDACGSSYTLSAPQQIGYLDKDGNFINDDEGIPVTHELPKESWYDLVKLNQAVVEFSK